MRDDTRPGRPARRAGTRQPVPPGMLAAAQPGGAASARWIPRTRPSGR